MENLSTARSVTVNITPACYFEEKICLDIRIKVAKHDVYPTLTDADCIPETGPIWISKMTEPVRSAGKNVRGSASLA